MKTIVLFLSALMIIFLMERNYRNRKLFLYPALFLCPTIGVLAYAGVLLSMASDREQTQRGAGWRRICIVLLYSLVLILGGSRTFGEWARTLVQFFTDLSPVKVLSGLVILISLLIYMLLARQLCGGNHTGIILFILFVCLMYLCGYRFDALTEAFLLGEESLDILALRQIAVPVILLSLLYKGTDSPLYEELTAIEEENHMEEQSKSKKAGKLMNVKTLTLALIILAMLTAFSVITLNTKINNMSLYMEHMQESIDESK